MRRRNTFLLIGIFSFILCLFLLSNVSAYNFTITNYTINNNETNITIYISGTLGFDVLTWDNSTFNITGGTNLLAFNKNGSIYGSSNINDNDGNINITLPPKNATYVLDNYNLTEGVTRENSPLWISSSTTTEKHIASNLTNTINTTVVLNVADCDTLGSISYTSDTGIYKINYTKSAGWFYQGQTYTCSNNKATIENVPIEKATNSNVFLLRYNADSLSACNAGVNAFSGYILLLGLVGIVFFLGLMIAYLVGLVDKSKAQTIGVVGAVVTIIMIGLLLVISIFLMSTLCGLF